MSKSAAKLFFGDDSPHRERLEMACYAGKYGKGNTIYRCFRRWTNSGVFDRMEKHLQPQAVSKKELRFWHLTALISKCILTERVRRKKGQQSIGKSRGGWTTKIHSVVADESMPLVRSLLAGSAGDLPEGQKLMLQILKALCYKKPC